MKYPREIREWLWLFLACGLFAACENNMKTLPNFRQKQISVDEGRNITAYMSENAKVKARLTAPYMRRNEIDSPYVEFPNTLHVDFFNDSLQVESIMNARYGKWREQEGKVFLKDSVRVINIKNGDTLYCRELWWDRARTGMEFFTDKPIRIRTRTHTLDGVGMESRQDFVNWHILQPVGIIKVPSSEFPN